MRRAIVLLVLGSLPAVAFAQDRAATASDGSSPNSTHGLVLIVSEDQPPEAPDSPALKECQFHNTPLECARFTVTLKNEGKENILYNWTTCGWNPYSVDLKKPDGTWVPFPRVAREGLGIVCESTIGGYSLIWHGRSYDTHLRLADPILNPDAAAPQTPPVAIRDRADSADINRRVFLMGPGPLTIRLHEQISGCIASDQVLEGETFSAGDPFLPSKCAGEKFLNQAIVVQSNELQLAANGTHD